MKREGLVKSGKLRSRYTILCVLLRNLFTCMVAEYMPLYHNKESSK